ncbi:MAG: hypothetical protein OXU37_02185 [Thaumarchaeota archaeon]|nr:hypothetical protein [Nitrososphaerota archaeon]
MALPTGFAKLDSILGGGLGGGAITDVYGPAGSGKTQLAKQAAAACLARGGSAVLVDTTGKFRPARLLAMMAAAGARRPALARLGVVRATSVAEQAAAVGQIRASAADLAIVDSATDLFSLEYGREAQIPKKNELFMGHMRDLARLALDRSIPVLVTNMVREFGGVERENLQAAMRQFAHARVRLSAAGPRRTGAVSLPGASARFAYRIGEAGLCEDPAQDI